MSTNENIARGMEPGAALQPLDTSYVIPDYDSEAQYAVRLPLPVGVEVRPYQVEAWSAIEVARSRGESRALVHMATGLGKTTIAAVDAMGFMRDNPDAKGLFLAHQTELVQQARVRFDHCSGGAITTGVLGRDREVGSSPDFTFTTLQNMRTKAPLFDPEQFDYVVVDESHHGKAETFERTIEYFEPKFLLGITATPDRTDLKEIREIFGQEVYSKTLGEAMAERLLASVDYRIIMDDITKTTVASNFRSVRELNNALFSPKRNEEVVSIIAKHAAEIEDPRTIIFCPSLAAAGELAGHMPHAAVLTSKLPPSKRKKAYESFRAGEIDTMIVVNMYEGIDIPDANLLAFLRTTDSPTVFQQQLGRGLRLTPSKLSVRVLDFVANHERLSAIQEIVTQVGTGLQTAHGRPAEGSEVADVFCLDNNSFDFEELVADIDVILRKLQKVALNMSNSQIVSLAQELSPNAAILSPQIKDLSSQGRFPSAPTIKDRFGSMAAFHQACGFEVKQSPADLSDDELIEKAKQLSLGNRIREKDVDRWSADGDFFSMSTLTARFGTLANFNIACGLPPGGKGMTKEEIIRVAVQECGEEPLSNLRISELAAKGLLPVVGTIRLRFGSMQAFYEACGYEAPDITTYSNQQLVELALQLNPDGPLGAKQINELSKAGEFIATRSINRKFGSLSAFHELCGFESRISTAFSREDIIGQAIDIINETGDVRFGAKRRSELSKAGKLASPSTILKRFGSNAEFESQCLAELERRRSDAGVVDAHSVRPEVVLLGPGEVEQVWKQDGAVFAQTPVKIDYRGRAARNAETGARGESIVVDIERKRLVDAGRPDLAEKVWQASLVDDGLGFDVVSFEDDGTKKYIEVKATTRPRSDRLKFYISESERRASEYYSNFYIHYVDDVLSESPRVTVIPCPIEETNFTINPISYIVEAARTRKGMA